MACLIIAGIAGGGYYLYRTKKTLKTVESDVKDGDKLDQNATSTDAEDNTKSDNDK